MTPYSFNQFISNLSGRKSGYCRCRKLGGSPSTDAGLERRSLRSPRINSPANCRSPKECGCSNERPFVDAVKMDVVFRARMAAIDELSGSGGYHMKAKNLSSQRFERSSTGRRRAELRHA
ncbi:hypothetical protein [Burkholderia ubonensis]|uniref:hypothetical protein n=1 Tax=Burkholderia ubonensis TaxID=101571 RepID=UPI0012FB6B30|nr:hypothetical protein [Burkholderia ubonensis]